MKGGNYRHGLTGTPLYRMWKGLKNRCLNPFSDDYVYYGSRGISVSPIWENNPVAFCNWARANGYRKGLQLDRIDNDGDYTPQNCRFITAKLNSNNTRKNIWRTAFTESKTLAQWAEDTRCKVKYATLYYRVNSGWAMEKALTTPSRLLRTPSV